MIDPWSWISTELSTLQENDLLRKLRCRESPPVDGRIQIDGHQLLNLGSNDYLGLAADSRVVDAVKRFAGYHGWGSGASPLVNGRGALHAELERQIAEFEQTQAALLFPTGFAANVGVISSLLDAHSVVFSDEKNHASIIDGIRLSRAQKCVFRHRDMDHLRDLLKQHQSAARRLIVTDSLFSMDGDVAPLADIAALAAEFKSMLVVDEAHATGVFGDQGRGIHERLGPDIPPPVIVGTLSKALGSIGGFVAGPANVVEWVWNKARSYMFSTAAPEVTCAATLAALDIVKSEPARRRELLENSQWLRYRLEQLGWNTGGSESQIVPIVIGDAGKTLEISQRLWNQGFFVPAIRTPAVPEHESLLRVSLCWQHRRKDLEKFLTALGPQPLSHP